jgi:quinol monooxygenase YgiN
MPIKVVALITAKPGKANEVKSLLDGLLDPTRVEDGCHEYVLHQKADDEHDFVMLEEWESQAHLDAHLKTPHLEAAFPEFDKYAASVDIRVYNKVR